MSTVHVMLVSAQATPNLTPALDPDLAPKEVVLLVSPDMRERACWLEEVYRPRGIDVEYWPIDDAWDIEHIQSRVLELLERERTALDDRSIALNATGGTKPMSIAAYEAFRAYDLPIYYVHPERDRLIWMHPADTPPHELAERIRIPDFLRAHGARVLAHGEVQVPPAQRDLARQLIERIDYFAGALGVLNWYASSAEKTLRSEMLDSRHDGFEALEELLEHLEQLGILKIESGRLVFADEQARFFANGGWLEQYVYATVNSLKKEVPAIHDTAQGLEIAGTRSNTKNELDVVFLANNRLHLIECKAKNFKRGDAGASADTLYRLDSLADAVGGLQTRAMLVSYKALPKHDARRARDLKIKVLQGRQLQQMKSQLRQWIQNR